MPQKLSKMLIPDPFVMNENTVNISIWEFLKDKAFVCPKPLEGRERGIDVEGKKANWLIYIESKGSHAITHDEDTVFDQGQIKVHTYNQIGKLMEFANENNEKVLLVMANPDTPRIRSRVEKVVDSLNTLGFIRFWVQQDRSVKVEFPYRLETTLLQLGLI